MYNQPSNGAAMLFKAAEGADAIALQKIAAGDSAAFESFYRSWLPRVYRYLARFLGDEALAEEASDDVLLDVWRSAARFRGGGKVSTWIFGIAHNKAVSALRRSTPGAVGLNEAAWAADRNPGAEAGLIEEADRRRIAEALKRLSPAHREVVWLAFYEGMSYQEIGAVMGCPEATVKSRMFYAKRALEQLLRAGGPQGERQ